MSRHRIPSFRINFRVSSLVGRAHHFLLTPIDEMFAGTQQLTAYSHGPKKPQGFPGMYRYVGGPDAPAITRCSGCFCIIYLSGRR